MGDRAGEGRTLKNLGDVRIQAGQPAQALDCYRQAVVIAQEVGDRHREGQALHGVGVALTELGEFAQAEKRLHEALLIRREAAGSPTSGAIRRYAEAQADYEASLACCALSATAITKGWCSGRWA